ncbi:MAG: zinc metallopeptidase [Fimbriimonadia bacterium]|nr:zinc metallopeptidase [Fimbriimonadia bacterium]
MRWKNREQSSNVEDRRGMRPSVAVGGGGLGIVLIALLVMLFGGDPSALLQGAGDPSATMQPGQMQPGGGIDDEGKEFVSVVLKDTEEVWDEIFRRMGRRYQKPTLVLFTDRVQSGCGVASAAMGPFYCPLDQKLYIDLSFYDELKNRFRAPGEFAQAYVIAHEVGHHVQNLLGTMREVQGLQQRSRSKTQANELSVRLELQADFYAGVWAHHIQKKKNILNRQDLEDALRAAYAIGDDNLQRQMQGHVDQSSFTHGSSEQRMYWFKKGWETGDIRQGDTFTSSRL